MSSALRRPSYWFLLGVLGLVAFGFSQGNVTIQSGEAMAGGLRSHITSVAAQSMFQSILITAMGVWFLAVGAGLVLIRDAELRVGEVIHGTRLTAREYVWGSFGGALAAFLVIWGLHLGLSVGFNHVLATGADTPHIGPFVPGNYLVPELDFERGRRQLDRAVFRSFGLFLPPALSSASPALFLGFFRLLLGCHGNHSSRLRN